MIKIESVTNDKRSGGCDGYKQAVFMKIRDKTCENCGVPFASGGSAYTAEDCGSNHSMWEPNTCTCGNPEWGFDCVCKHVADNPGDIHFSCEYCGLYTASKPRCNKCEE